MSDEIQIPVPPPPHQPVTASPVATTVRIDVVNASSTARMVRVTLNTPIGEHVFFFEPGPAQQCGSMLIAAGKHADSGIVVPKVVIDG